MSTQTGEQAVIANEEFLAMLAHELRNPLAPIRNALHVIERNARGGSNLVKNAADILGRQVNYIVGVIDNLLDIAKIAKGELKINFARVELCELIRDSVECCRPTFSSRRHTIETTLPEKSIYVRGDKGRLQQIITHLLNNAAKFTETGGKIAVSMSYNSNRAMINVRDNGVGIPPESTHAVFDLFNQPDHTRHMAQGGGLGIGLALSQQIAQLHEGDIEVYSSGLGQGTEFTVVLPVVEVNEVAVTTPPPEKPKVQERCLEILVVDDHIDTAESLSTLLKMWGHVVHVAHNGSTAIQTAKIYQPDIAILDIGLPGCDGYQVAEKLKKECKDTLLIAVTGYGQDVDQRKSTQAGFSYHLIKPVVPETLRETINTKMYSG
jgi:two-component system CheB/CheR fusion protein